ncbi:MAG TPA: glycosyltransferase family 39 protein [Candidatus Krumholzibacteria bacterium]
MNEVTASISRASGRRVIVAITLLAAIVRLVRIGAQSLWVDEMLTLEVATPKPGISLLQLLLHNIHGPLHTFVVALMRLVSENDGWLRLPSAVAGTFSVPLLYAWVRPRFGARAAAWAALLLAVNPLHIHYSQELRNYAFTVFFVLAGCVMLDRVCARWSFPRAAGFAACVAGAVLSNFSACFTFLVQSLVFFRAQPARGRALARWLVIAGLVILITSPWIYRVTTYVDFGKLATPVRPGELAETERLRGDTTFRIESIPYAFYAYSVGFALGPTLAEMHGDLDRVLSGHRGAIAWTALVFGTLALFGVRRALRRDDGAWRALEPVLYVAVPLAATLLLNWQNAKAFNVRYVLVGLPMYLALVGLGIAGGKRRDGTIIAGALVLATTAVALRNYYTDPARWKEDVRGATRAIEARLAPGECIFAPTVFHIVAHYQETGAPLHYIYRGNRELTDREFRELFAACPSFWYLRARPWVDDADGYVLSTLESKYRRDAVMEFPGVTALHFVPRN